MQKAWHHDLPNVPICSDRTSGALPRFYLLGQQKSGTTTMATAFFQAGVVPMVDYRPVGNVPGYLRTVRDNHSRTHLAGNVKESNLLASVSSPTCLMPTCLKFAQRKWERKFSNFTECTRQWRDTLLGDLSTDNFPHGYRAPTLRSFYGMPSAKRLIFVVIMREPLQRFELDRLDIARLLRDDRRAGGTVAGAFATIFVGEQPLDISEEPRPDPFQHCVDADRSGDVVEEIDQHRDRQQHQDEGGQQADLRYEA